MEPKITQADPYFAPVPSEQEKHVLSRPSSLASLSMWLVVELYFDAQGSTTHDRSLAEEHPPLA